MTVDNAFFSFQDLYNQAVDLYEQGELVSAIHLYEQILQAFPDAEVLHYNLGLAYYQHGNLESASSALRRAAELSPTDPDIWFNLGLVCKKLERVNEAVNSYKKALELSPDDLDILYNLGCCCKDFGALDEAVAVYTHLLECDAAYIPAINNLAYVYQLQGKLDEAKRLYSLLVKLDPDHEHAEFMAAAVKGEEVVAPPEAFVRDLFDQYSENFDEDLLNNLSYQVPEKIVSLLAHLAPERKFDYCIDLGCGTGLCGALLRPFAVRLSGVDLSPRMLEEARKKECYDDLYEAGLIDFLKSSTSCYDLFVAADVFSYLGDFGPVFSAIKKRASIGAMLLFSVEQTASSNWELQQNGRYAHGHDYIVRLADDHDFSLCHYEHNHLRKERGTWVDGALYILHVNK